MMKARRLIAAVMAVFITVLSFGALRVEAAQFALAEAKLDDPVGIRIPEKPGDDSPLMGGRIPFRYNGFVKAQNGFWFVENGVITEDRNGLVEGEIEGEKTWWFLRNSKVDFDANTVAKKEDGWWKITGGKIEPDYNGLESNAKGFWYIRDGRIDFNYCGILDYEGEEWLVVRGQASQITKANDMTLYRAFKTVEKITTDKMSKAEKLKACWDYVQSMEEVNTRLPHYTGDDWPMIYAEDVFLNEQGNCISFAAALGYMAKALGYKEVYVCHSGEHGWAEIDGLVYDPEWALHHDGYNYYALSYDEPTDQNYKDTIAWCTEPGYEWMRKKI